MTPAQCRAEIERMAENVPVARAVLSFARREGMNTEDAYSLMAYHALVQLKDANERLMVQAMSGPAAQITSAADWVDTEIAEAMRRKA